MKISVFFEGCYPNGNTPMSYRLHFYLKALQSENCEVNVVMPSSIDRKGNTYEGVPYSFITIPKETIYNFYYVSSKIALICGELCKNCDVLFYVGERKNFRILKVLRSVHLAKGKIAFEINENPYSGFKVHRVHIPLIIKLQRYFFFNIVLKRMDGVIVISYSLFHLLKPFLNNEAQIIRIPILTDYVSSKPKESKSLNEEQFILHAGSFSNGKDGIKAMLMAYIIVLKNHPTLRFIFTSKSGSKKLISWVDNFIFKNNLYDKVIFKGLISRGELVDLYNKCTLSIVNKPRNEKNNYNFPTKLTELIPREIPTIISKTGEMNFFFEDRVNAIMVEPDDIHKIADSIEFILSYPDQVSVITKHAKEKFYENFYYLNYANELFSFFRSISNSKN